MWARSLRLRTNSSEMQYENKVCIKEKNITRHNKTIKSEAEKYEGKWDLFQLTFFPLSFVTKGKYKCRAVDKIRRKCQSSNR